jgi:hypothetical protein
MMDIRAKQKRFALKISLFPFLFFSTQQRVCVPLSIFTVFSIRIGKDLEKKEKDGTDYPAQIMKKVHRFFFFSKKKHIFEEKEEEW